MKKPLPVREHKKVTPSEFMAEVAMSTNFKPFPAGSIQFASGEYIEPEIVQHIRNDMLLRAGESMDIPLSYMSEQPMWMVYPDGTSGPVGFWKDHVVHYEPETLLDKLWSWIWRKL